MLEKTIWGSNEEHRIISKNITDKNKYVKQKLQIYITAKGIKPCGDVETSYKGHVTIFK